MKVYFLDDYREFNSLKQIRLFVKRNNIAPDILVNVDDLNEFLAKTNPVLLLSNNYYKGCCFFNDLNGLRNDLLNYMINKELNKEVIKD